VTARGRYGWQPGNRTSPWRATVARREEQNEDRCPPMTLFPAAILCRTTEQMARSEIANTKKRGRVQSPCFCPLLKKEKRAKRNW
jgi:hypothetical protein